MVVCVIVVALSDIKFHLANISHAAFVRTTWSTCSVVMLFVFLIILQKDIVAFMRFRFGRHFDIIWSSFILVHRGDLIDSQTVRIFIFAYAAANKVYYEG